jgi:type III restriction enzyme
VRNPTTESQGFGIPLPRKVADSSTFYPDFLIWKKDVCRAVDTTGRRLLDEKVRGKLVALEIPRMSLVVRGTVDLGSGSREARGMELGRGAPQPQADR